MNASEDSSPRIPRRTVLKWFAATTAALNTPGFSNFPADAAAAEASGVAAATGYGTDPKVNQIYNPGDFWPLTFTPEQKKTATALADVILPADDFGPAASSLRVPDFIDEWVSAPYGSQQNDAKVVIPGLKWIEDEAQKRFSKGFADLTPEEQTAICDDICWPRNAKPEFKEGARFFDKFRQIAAGAYYSTPEGWKAIGYVGNLPLVQFDGPPQEVLDRLGVTQTVA